MKLVDFCKPLSYVSADLVSMNSSASGRDPCCASPHERMSRQISMEESDGLSRNRTRGAMPWQVAPRLLETSTLFTISFCGHLSSPDPMPTSAFARFDAAFRSRSQPEVSDTNVTTRAGSCPISATLPLRLLRTDLQSGRRTSRAPDPQDPNNQQKYLHHVPLTLRTCVTPAFSGSSPHGCAVRTSEYGN